MLAGGSIAILLHAASGHATTFGSPAPVLAVAVHMAAAGAWLAGLLTLGWLAFGGAGRRRSLLRAAIPRFSAVALPAVALFGLTGLYLWWLMLRQPLDTSNGYGALLAIKLVGGLAAVAVGGLNYLGWRREGVVGEHRRVAFEAALALGVVAVTALMVSGSPPGLTRPVPIERASTSALSVLDAGLALLPARPGPNRVFVTPASPVAAGQRLELVLERVDASGGTTVELHSATTAAGSPFTTDVPLAGDSSWDATVRLLADGVEQARARWTFALDDTRLAAGRAQPLVNPLLLVALALAGLAMLALLLVAGGVSPPRTERSVTRGLMLGSGIIGAVLAALMLALPPQV
jgi:hypothetical protein